MVLVGPKQTMSVMTRDAVTGTCCSTRSQSPASSWSQLCVTSSRPTPSLEVWSRSAQLCLCKRWVLQLHALFTFWWWRSHKLLNYLGSKIKLGAPKTCQLNQYYEVCVCVCVCVLSQESVPLESHCSTWAGINTTASSSTRVIPVETMEAGRPPVSETTVL